MTVDNVENNKQPVTSMSYIDFNIAETDDFTKLVLNNGYDFMDFGCSKGGSLLFGEQGLGGIKGLGIDCEQSKVDLTRAAGFDAVKFNIHDIADKKVVRFVVMSHFLEHVPDPADVNAFMQKACSISTDFVFIQQPFFDADGYLANKGLKLFWSDWRGHPNRMTSLEVYVLLRNLKEEGLISNYSINFKGKILSSDDRRIHSILSPIDQHEHEIGKHPDKGEEIMFDEPVYAEISALITMPGFDHASQLERLKFDYTIIDSNKVGVIRAAVGQVDKEKPGSFSVIIKILLRKLLSFVK